MRLTFHVHPGPWKQNAESGRFLLPAVRRQTSVPPVPGRGLPLPVQRPSHTLQTAAPYPANGRPIPCK